MNEMQIEPPNEMQRISGCFCPVCNAEIEDFTPGGVVHKRSRARCPSCGVLERHRLMALYLRSHTSIFSEVPKRVLHVAPERPVADLIASVPRISYLSADLSGKDVMVKMDLTDIHYEDGHFDIIICSHVLEHIPDDRLAMREMFRVLAHRGLAVIQVPIYGSETYEDFTIDTDEKRLAAFGQKDHVRKYGEDIGLRLQGSGFEVTVMRNPADRSICHRLGLKPSPIFDCRKP